MRCPRDEVTLDAIRFEGEVEGEICPACGGVWLTRDEVERLQEVYVRKATRIPPDHDAMTLGLRMAQQKALPASRCPVCAEENAREEYAQASSVLVDVCPNAHGMWLDKGELEAIEEWYALQNAEARGSFWSEFLNLLGRRWD